jgi:hypothetical protein
MTTLGLTQAAKYLETPSLETARFAPRLAGFQPRQRSIRPV